MTDFPLFNLELINSITHEIRLKSINEETLKILTATNAYYERLGLYYLGKRGKEQHRKNLIGDIEKLNAKKFKEDLNSYREECEHFKLYSANMTLKKFMANDPWKRWFQARPDNKKLAILKKFWESNEATNHLTNDALIAIVTEILPVYNDFYNLAILEIKCFCSTLPANTLLLLNDYFNSIQVYINNENHKICDAMLARLQTISVTKDIYCSDVNSYVIKQLSMIGITLKESILRKNKILTAQQFDFFHRYILAHGNQNQKNELKKLSWLINDHNFKSISVKDRIVIIPQEARKQGVVIKIFRSLWRLFNSVDERVEFFEKKFYLLAQIRCHLNPACRDSLALSDLINRERWQKLNIYESYLLKELSDIKTGCSSRWNRLFKPLFVKNCQTLKRCLQDALAKNLYNKILYAELLAEQLRTRMVFDLDRDLIFSKDVKGFVRKLINDIENLRNYLNQSSKKENTWGRVKCILEIFLTKNEVDKQSGESQSIAQKSNNIIIPNKSLQSNTPKLISIGEEIKNVYNQVTEKRFFDLALIADCLPRWNLLFVLGEYKIKQDFSFWKDFVISYINTHITLGNENELLQKLTELIFKFGHEQIVTYAKSINLFSAKIGQHDYLRLRILMLDFREESLNSRDLVHSIDEHSSLQYAV